MADGEQSALGLSVGATNLAAVTAERSVTRKPVLTLYRQRPPEVGVPSENPKLNEPGLVITDFVDRVGDPAGIEAARAARMQVIAVTTTYPEHELKSADAIVGSLAELTTEIGKDLIKLQLAPVSQKQ